MSMKLVGSGLALLLAACSGSGGDTVGQTAQPELANQAATGVSTPAADGPRGHMGHAGPGHMDPAKLIARFDANHDGQLQVSELPDHMQRFVGKADANADGVLSADELAAARDHFRAERLARLDTDHDGAISDAERQAGFAAMGEKRFAHADANGDGAITANEIDADKWAHISVADANGDGRITLDEIRAAVAAGKLSFRGHHDHDHAGAPAQVPAVQ
jgi:hypothetical protein